MGYIQINSRDKETLANETRWGHFMKLWGTGSKNVISESFAKGYEAQTNSFINNSSLSRHMFTSTSNTTRFFWLIVMVYSFHHLLCQSIAEYNISHSVSQRREMIVFKKCADLKRENNSFSDLALAMGQGTDNKH